MNLNKFSIKEIVQGLENKKFSAKEIVEFFLSQIEKLDKEIKAFLTVSEKLALSQAQKIDEMVKNKEKLPSLAGVPVAIKDNILVRGLRCTAGSKILENYIAPYDATVIKKLKEKGVIIIGKTNLDEFAMGSSCENSAFFPTRNPRDLERVPGGSSGGSAAAVGGRMSVVALGSDTGGSIRQPASFCGIVGFKPSYGVVSRYGLIAMASSLDQIGPFANKVEDVELVFEAIAGKDENDNTTINFHFEKPIINLSDFVVGVPKEFFTKGLQPEVETTIKKVLEKIEKGGIKIKEVSLPHSPYALAAYYVIVPSEVSANLARYDGIKYGFCQQGKDLLETYLKTKAQGFGDEVKRRIMLGTYALSSGYYDAYYLQAQKVRAKIKEDFDCVFQEVDVVVGPTSPTVPFKLGEKTQDPLQMYLADIFTVPVNLAGLPGISLPCQNQGELPIGLQIIAPQFADNKLIEVAKIFEKILKE